LLAAVQPKFAIISDGFRNPFGHPRMIVLQRLQDAHVRTYRTDMLGVVTFWLDGNQVTAQPALLGHLSLAAHCIPTVPRANNSTCPEETTSSAPSAAE
jgi:hypothetical protein